MGAGSDVRSKGEVIENSYLSDSTGIERLLKSVFEIVERSRYKFDPSATTLINDLEMALDTDIFTPIERQSLALTYYAQLTYRQSAKLLDVKTPEIMDALTESIEKIAAVLMGYRTQALPAYQRQKYTLNGWIIAVGNGQASIYDVPTEVNTELLQWLTEEGDSLAEETLRQRVEGAPVFIDQRSEAEQYPCYTWEQLRNMDRNLNVKVLDNKGLARVASGRTTVGSRKVAFYDENHVMSVVKGRIYK